MFRLTGQLFYVFDSNVLLCSASYDLNILFHKQSKFSCQWDSKPKWSATVVLSGVESVENRWLDLCLQVFLERHLCCLRGADVFLNPFFKWPCCTVCPDSWTEDKARLAAWPSLKSSVCSPYAARRGSSYMMCSCLHSFLVERWHWTVEDGERSLGAKYWGLHTLQHRPIYSIKMWYLISYAPGCTY